MVSLNKNDIALIKWLNKQKDPVYQSEIPRLTGLSPKIVTKSLYKLEKMGLIERKPTVYKKHKTYIVTLNVEKTIKALEEIGETLLEPIELFEQISSIPCVSCPYINRCFSGGFYDPVYCPHISRYFFSSIG